MPAAKKKAKKPTKISRGTEFTKSLNDVPTFYANNTNIMITPYDLKLTFGQIIDSSDKSITVAPQTIVMMSVKHARAVRDLLVSQLDKYDEITALES